MKPRPLYRWKSFWLGVLVLGFLGWAWVRSYHHYEYLEYYTGLTSGGVILQSRGSILAGFNDPTAGGNPVRFHSEPMEWDESDELFPAAMAFDRWELQEGWGLTSRIEVAHWFLILLVLVPWSAFLAWRWRRVRNEHRTSNAQHGTLRE